MKEFGKKLSLVAEAPRAPPAEAPQLRALQGHADVNQFRQLADMVFLPSQVLQPHERAYVIDLIRVALPALRCRRTPEFRQTAGGKRFRPGVASRTCTR